MPYIINKSDGSELTVLDDATINTSTDLGLIGRNYFGYGEIQNENFIFLLENFANTTPPPRPIKGQLWYDTTNNLVKSYNGIIWNTIGSAIVSEVEPISGNIGSFWLKSPSNILHVYNGSSWHFVGPETAEGFGVTRAVSTTVLDTFDNVRPIIQIKVDDIIIAIVSKNEFTIKSTTPIVGFTNIKIGITISSSAKIYGDLVGLAERATRFQTTRLINGVGFNGENDINILAASPASLTPGNYIIGDFYDGSTNETWSINASPFNETNKIVARNSSGDFSARQISAASFIGTLSGNVNVEIGTSNFNVVNANSFIGSSFSGNSATATRLQTPRRINNVLFSGVEDIIITANAETLTGTFLRSTVLTSNLQSVGKLSNVSVNDEGISIGTSGTKLQLIVDESGPNIYSLTGKLGIGAGFTNDLILLNASQSLASGGQSKSSLSPQTNLNIDLGLPSKRFDRIYGNQFIGNATSSTTSITATNLAGGSIGSLVYQTSTGVTQYIPIGAVGQVLKIANNFIPQWETNINQNLNPGAYLSGGSFNGLAERTWSVNATSSNISNTIAARDSSGNFSANTITAQLVGNISGNASSANRLSTARKINEILFDGTSDILLPGVPQAWVKFRGSTGQIINSLNVTSVTKISTGRFTINILPGVFSNRNYTVVGSSTNSSIFVSQPSSVETQNSSITQALIVTRDAAVSGAPLTDPAEISVILLGSLYQSGETPPEDTGQIEWTVPGTYSWVVPIGITSVSAVLIGGGGAGGSSNGISGPGTSGGGGGGLRWINNLSVIPGETLTVRVGAGGAPASTSSTTRSGSGENSIISRALTTLIFAGGGEGGLSNATSGAGGVGGQGSTVSQSGSTVIGGGNGGQGGPAQNNGAGAGGGGAGGYTGNGGSANQNGSGGGGAGGQAINSQPPGARGSGGGVGIYGQGTNGNTSSVNLYSGSGGTPPTDTKAGQFGGGGAGVEDDTILVGSSGGDGAIRIIWGPFRSFPNTNTGNL